MDEEIERKFLLTGLPDEARSAPSEEIEQGWIPGTAIHERLRRVRPDDGSGEKYLRTIKLGRGVKRIEVEEETDEATFRHLWALTQGRRVHKRRYRVQEGAFVWEIDAFLDRDLYLAEVELPSEKFEVSIPGWLAPFVVREVTGEDAFVNLNLAK